ncbi:MAG: hypothetical protein ACI8W8_001845 [Rhodothermales bacterium]|jgi:hypothetical protein
MSESPAKSVSVKKRLADARRAMVATRILLGCLKWGAVLMAIWLLLFAMDNLMRLPSGLRFPLSVCAAGFCLRGLLRQVLRPALKRQTMEQTAVLLEQNYEIPRNVLINSYQLEQRELEGTEATFAEQTQKAGDASMTDVPIRELWQLPRVGKLAAAGLGLAILWGMYLSMAPAQAANAAMRFGLPLADVPPLGAVTLQLDPPDHASVVQGDNLEIRVVVQVREDAVEEDVQAALIKALLRIVLRPGEKLVSSTLDRERAVTMAPLPRQDVMAAISERSGEHPSPGMLDAHGTDFEKLACRDDVQAFVYTVTNVKRGFSFRIFHEQGGTHSRAIRVGVRVPPKIKGSQFHLTPPEYTGVDTVSMLGPPHAVSGLKGSKLLIEVEPDRKVEGLSWIAHGTSVPFVEKKGVWTAETVLSESGPYEVASESNDIGRPAAAAIGGIVIRDDMPPRIDFATTNRSQSAIPGEKIQLKVQASDDFGIADVEVYMRSALGGGGSELIKSWTFGAPPGKQGGFKEEFVLELHPSTFMPGAEYVLEALCHDYHPRRQQGRSRPYLLRIQDVTAAEVFVEDQEMASAMQELDYAIELQQAALAATRNLQTYLVDALGLNEDGGSRNYSLPAHEAKIWDHQLNVRRALKKLIETLPEPKPDFIGDVRKLVDNEATVVLEAIPKLRAVSHPLGDAEYAKHNRFPESNRWQEEQCPPKTGRFVGLVARSSNRYGSEAAIAEFALLQPNGVAYPRKFVQSWQAATTRKPWPNDKRFVDLPRAERTRIVEEARLAPMSSYDSSIVDFTKFLPGPHENTAAYVYRKIKTPKTMTARLLVGSDDAVRVWLNDELVLHALASRSVLPDEDSAAIELIEGDNHMLVEVSNGLSDFGLALRFARPDGTPLGVSEDGGLSPVPNMRVAFYDSMDGDNKPEYAIDEITSTAWVTTYKEMPHGIFFDLGAPLPIGGFRYKPQDGAFENWIRLYDFYVLDELRSSQSLPAPLRAIERQQSFILDQLVAIRGTEVKKVATVARLKGDLRNDAAPTAEVTASAAIDDFYTEVRTFAAEARQLATARKQILDNADGELSAADLDALEEMRFKEARLAKSLERAVQEMKELGENIELVDSSGAAELQKIIESAENLSLQAEAGVRRKAEDESSDTDEDAETVALAEQLLQDGPPELNAPEPEAASANSAEDGLSAALDAIFEELAVEQEAVVQDLTQAADAAGMNLSRQVDALGGTGEAPEVAAAQTGVAANVPAALQGQMQRSAAAQAQVRESAEEVRMRLTAHNLQNANLDAAIAAMERGEAAAASGNLFEMRRAFTEAATLANAAGRSIGRSTGVQKMQGRLGERSGAGSHVAGRSAPPKGYEHMVGAYFKKLAEAQ